MTSRGAAHRVTIAGSGESFEVPAGERIHAAARRAGVWLPFECGWGSCGTCKATVVEGDTALLFPAAPAVDPRDARRRRVVLCQSTAATDAVIRPIRVADQPPDERPTRDYLGELSGIEALGPDISRFRFRLRTPDGSPALADYRPGQYAILELDPGLRRCYSMAGLPGEDTVEFIARRYPGGLGSERLFSLLPGDRIPVELPYGDMWLRDSARPRLLIAGGTGISAILALARGMAATAAAGTAAATAAQPASIIYGASSAAELVCWEDLASCAARIPGMTLTGALVTPHEGWPGVHGFVTEALPDALARLGAGGGPEQAPNVYLAGPPAMVRAVEQRLDEHGIQRDRLHVDSFG